MNLDWMNDPCLHDDNIAGERMGRPFNATDSAGKRWRCATNGQHMTCVEIGDEVFPEGSETAPDVRCFLDAKIDPFWTGEITLLRAHVGPLPSGACVDCRGSGLVACNDCGGSHIWEYDDEHGHVMTDTCSSCNSDGKAKCYACDGSGRAPLRQVRHIRIRDVPFNASLVALTLRDAPRGQVAVGFYQVDKRRLKEPPALAIIGAGWRGFIMPMRFEPEEIAKFPRVEL